MIFNANKDRLPSILKEFIVPALLKKIFFYSLLVYAILGFLVLPYFLKSQLRELVSQQTNAKVEIGTLYINPFLFKFKLSDVVFKNLQNEELISFKEFFADVELYSLLRKAIHFREISLVAPKVSLARNADKTYNLLNILKNKEKTAEDDNSSFVLPRVILDSVKITSGEVNYKDFTLKAPFSFKFSAVGLHLQDVDTGASQKSEANMHFYATLEDGGFVDFKSDFESLEPLKAKGTVDFEASKLSAQSKYARETFNLELAGGKISFTTEYAFDLGDINATKIENLLLNVQKLKVKPKAESEDVLNIENFLVKNATVFPFAQRIDIEKISLNGLNFLVKRDANGTIDWEKYIEINKDENSSNQAMQEEKSVAQAKPWSIDLKDVSLENIAFAFQDSGVSPRVDTEINSLNIYAGNVTLLGEKAFTYKMNMRLNERGECSSDGRVAHKSLNVESLLECKSIDVAHYDSYIRSEAKKLLKRYEIELKKASLNFHTNLHLQENNDSVDTLLFDTNLSLNNLQINKKDEEEELVAFSDFFIEGIDLDTKTRSVAFEKMALNGLNVNLQKYKNSSLNIQNLVELKKSTNKDKQKTQEKPYSLKLKHFALSSASVAFQDNSLKQAARNKIHSVNLNAYDIDLVDNSWLRYELEMKVNSGGTLQSTGKLRHTPLKQLGEFEMKNISLVGLNPYIYESAYMRIEDAKLSLKGKTAYEKNAKSADLRVDGSLSLKSLFVNETLDETPLFSLGELKADAYTFELEPNGLHIDEVDINSFYVDASIDKNKTFNFSKLMKKKDVSLSKDIAQAEAVDQNSTFAYRVSKINVSNASANFSDYSIPIEFSTRIHDFGGRIYSVSNSAKNTAYVDMVGEIDKYATAKIQGSIDIANPKAYANMKFDFENLDLNSLSGYSASYAGYEIDSGKLYLDLGYDILDAQLLASNSVMIKNIKLGKRVRDKNVRVMPLRFAIGILQGRDGVININMPLRGNLDAPNFKYGALVFRTFSGLVARAVASPFALLGSVVGMKGEELEYIAYEPGSSEISPSQREKLDKLEQLLFEKPKIILHIAGAYEKQKDKKALQYSKLVDLAVKKSGIKNVNYYKSAISIETLEDIYEDMSDDDALHKTQNKLRSIYKEDADYMRAYQNKLIVLCRELQEVTQEELMALAQSRADRIIAYLAQKKRLDSNRVEKKPSYVRQESSIEFVKIKMKIEAK